MISMLILQIFLAVDVGAYEHPECEPGREYKYDYEGMECIKKCLNDSVNYKDLFCCPKGQIADRQIDGTHKCKDTKQFDINLYVGIVIGLVAGILIAFLIQNIIKKGKGSK
jgi:hypothetical protein